MPNSSSNKVQPFLQWVGGKRKLTDKLIQHMPNESNNYYEPFLGGGALFFQVKHRFKKCFLSDINFDLITSYNAIKKNSKVVSKLLENHNKNHSKDYYFQIRDINNSNNPYIISARFLYLNRYSFKGIYSTSVKIVLKNLSKQKFYQIIQKTLPAGENFLCI